MIWFPLNRSRKICSTSTVRFSIFASPLFRLYFRRRCLLRLLLPFRLGLFLIYRGPGP